jgi:hypothetical protein
MKSMYSVDPGLMKISPESGIPTSRRYSNQSYNVKSNRKTTAQSFSISQTVNDPASVK